MSLPARMLGLTLWLAAVAAGAADLRRPQLSDEQALAYERRAVLAAAGPLDALQRDGWDPLADAVITGDAPPARWHYRVDPAHADGRSVFASVQAALRQAHLDTLAGHHAGTPRLYIAIAPGRYPELVVVPPTPLPITLWGLGATPDDVLISAGLHSQMSGAELLRRHGAVFDAADQHPDIAEPLRACARNPRIGTGCTATLRVRNHGFQLRGVRVDNSFQLDQPGPAEQAVALMTEGADRVHLEQVVLWGWQDTLYLRSPGPDAVARVAVHRSLVAGDVDFIFGNAIAWFHRSEIRFLGRRPGGGQATAGYVAAPSTARRAPYGFVFDDCDFSSDGQGLAAADRPGQVALARQWFAGARCSPFGQATDQQPNGTRCLPEPALAAGRTLPADGRLLASASLEAVGRMVVLRSRLGPHIRPDAPWADWSSQPSHPGYRRVMTHSDALWLALQSAGHDPSRWGWQRPVPAEPWLAEYLNLLSAQAQPGQRQ